MEVDGEDGEDEELPGKMNDFYHRQLSNTNEIFSISTNQINK